MAAGLKYRLPAEAKREYACMPRWNSRRGEGISRAVWPLTLATPTFRMNPPQIATKPRPEERLLHFQLTIARRADKIMQQNEGGIGGDLIAWLQAEREVLAPANAVHEAADAFLSGPALD